MSGVISANIRIIYIHSYNVYFRYYVLRISPLLQKVKARLKQPGLMHDDLLRIETRYINRTSVIILPNTSVRLRNFKLSNKGAPWTADLSS
jgi:hypothetical protein